LKINCSHIELSLSESPELFYPDKLTKHKRNASWIICMVLSVLVLPSCDYFPTQASKDKGDLVLIAKASGEFLYQKDIKGLIQDDMSFLDSSKIVNIYIDSWIKKQLMISKASDEISFDLSDIDRKVLDYKYALMVHEYEKFYISKNLNKNISEQEITAYYNERSENFILRQNIIRCLFAIIPKQAPQINTFRKQIRSFPDANMEEIKSYCFRFATKSSLETGEWINFDEILATTPLANVQDRVTFLKTNSFVETSDEENIYYLRILDYKISNQISPIEFVTDDINSILINKKKEELRKKLEDEVYEKAEQEDEFEIY